MAEAEKSNLGLAITPVEVVKPKINVLVYGPPGSGKTVLAATAAEHPDLGEVLFLNFEGGLLSLGTRKGISQTRIRDIEDVERVFWALINKDPAVRQFRTVVIDSGSELQTLDLEQTATKAYNNVNKRGKRESIDEVYQEDYGKSTTRLRRIFRWFRDAPVNVIITALPKRTYKKAAKDQEPELLEVVPSFTDKLGGSVMGYVDFVWYLFRDEETGARKLLTQDVGKFRAKTRGQKFAQAIGACVTEPNIATLYNTLLQSEGSSK